MCGNIVAGGDKMKELNLISDLLKEFEIAEERLNKLPELLQIQNEALQDIVHFAEITLKPMSSDSNKYFKKLGEIRRERRKIKNEMQILEEFVKLKPCVCGYLASSRLTLGKIKSRIENPVYTVRQLSEDFGETM